MNREIPGYYYDAEKKKYFKIEASKTAPSDAAWSLSNVKRRKVEQLEREAEQQRVSRKARATVKRASAKMDSVSRALLGREIAGRGAVAGERCRAWAEGLCEKGGVEFEGGGCVSVMWVGAEGGGDMGDLGVVYTALDDEPCRSSYIPRNEDDRIDFTDATLAYFPGTFTKWPEPMDTPQLSSLRFHKPSRAIFATSREPSPYASITFWFPMIYKEPKQDRNPRFPHWQLGTARWDPECYGIRPRAGRECVVNTCATESTTGIFQCVVGTNQGILRLRDREALTWLSPPASGPLSDSSAVSSAMEASQGDILALEYLPLNPAEVLLFGTRSGTVGLLDQRTPTREWFSLEHKSSVAHLKAVGEFEVLAAGPKSAMAVYDLRCIRDGANNAGGQVCGNKTMPIVQFAEYKNQAHIHMGLDVLVEPGLDGGVVAAAHDDGKVALFSLRDGKRLKSPAVDAINVNKAGAGNVVKSLQFATMPCDKLASLFVGEGARINKYSFGRGDEGDGF